MKQNSHIEDSNKKVNSSKKQSAQKIKYNTYGMIRRHGVKHELPFGVIQFLCTHHSEPPIESDQIKSKQSKNNQVMSAQNTTKTHSQSQNIDNTILNDSIPNNNMPDNATTKNTISNTMMRSNIQAQIIAVSKKAGIAVTRNKIKRRLKHIFRDIVKKEKASLEKTALENSTMEASCISVSFIIRIYKDISKIPFAELREQIQEIYILMSNKKY